MLDLIIKVWIFYAELHIMSGNKKLAEIKQVSLIFGKTNFILMFANCSKTSPPL